MNLWQRKLLAFLHDPPEKAYNYGPLHQKQAQRYLERILGAGRWTDHQPDWAAAAADRFIFPTTKRLEGDRWVDTGAPGLSEGVKFVHPLTGTLAFTANDFPDENTANDIISAVLPSFGEGNDKVQQDAALQFWLLWRAWLHFSVTHHHGQRQGADKLAYLPADTRVPAGTIWHHNAIVSALEAARDAHNRFAPALLLFQIAPVQDFIAQARSTRDLWSGSYLLSWMMAHAMQLLTQRLGPDCIVFPSLRGQPLHDWLNKPKLTAAKYREDGHDFWTSLGLDQCQDLVLTPTLPNRFLAIVPADFNAEDLVRVFDYGTEDSPEQNRSEWRRICDACWDWLNSRAQLCPPSQENVKLRLWRFQCRHFWQICWQLWPWQEVKPALDYFAALPAGQKAALDLSRQVALAIPDEHKDTRCYTDDLREIKNPGWAWNAHYQLLAHRLDARRHTRNFHAWQGVAGAHKDALSGKEEAIADARDWLPRAQAHAELRHLFRQDDDLGAVNLIKRVWHKAYLEQLLKHHHHLGNLRRARESFDSVPALAARPFAEWLRAKTNSGPLREPFLTFIQAASEAREYFPETIAKWENNEDNWFQRTDASVFHLNEWDRAIEAEPDAQARQRLEAARAALATLLDKCGPQPARYYAVLALDGDQIGKWLSGEKTPAIAKVITQKAANYFQDQVKGVDVEQWLNSPRPLSPSYHLQFSEALANFGLYCARRIVEAHHGQLIYSGGDDVVAMLPAAEAVACAQGLRLAFQGKSAELVRHANGRYAHLFDADVPEGFIRLREGERARGCRRPAEPSWPLLLPGPNATVSVGIAIGHIREPLQDMVHEAQAAEKRAKADPQRKVWDETQNRKDWKSNEGWNRDALAVTLFKRSGETIRWGAKFGSAAFPLLELFQDYYRPPASSPQQEMPISGKFPYRVAELLGKYGQGSLITEDLAKIAKAEFTWITQQQIRQIGPIQSEKALDQLRQELCDKAEAYLRELRNFTWKRPEPDGSKPEVPAPRPLGEFIHLFLLEAFIARTGE